jgi:anti-anti-sigma factor
MEIEIRARLGRSVEIRPSGELDMATAPDLERVVGALEEHDTATVLIQADAITFMDAAGLAPLIAASQKMEIVVLDPSRAARRLLELAGMDGWIIGDRGTGRALS